MSARKQKPGTLLGKSPAGEFWTSCSGEYIECTDFMGGYACRAALQQGLASKRPAAGAGKPGAAKRKKVFDSEDEDSDSSGDS